MLKDKLNLINSEDYSDDIDITLTYYINIPRGVKEKKKNNKKM